MTGQARRGGGGRAPTHSQPGARKRWVVSRTLRPLYPQEKLGTHCTGGWMGLGNGLAGTKNLAPTCIRSPDRPTRSKSLHRLRYPGRLPKPCRTKFSHPLTNIRESKIFRVRFIMHSLPCTTN